MPSYAEKPPFPFPPLEGALEQFPDAPPWDVPIAQMSNWWLAISCSACRMGTSTEPVTGHHPLRLMAARLGWRRTLRDIVPKLKCKTCGNRPTAVVLEDSPQGGSGRFGAKAKHLKLR